MQTPQKRDYWSIIAAGLVIILAVFCRAAGKNGFLPSLTGLLRSILYIGLYIAWGISVHVRIIQPQTRRYLIAVSMLMVFWFSIRTIKFLFVIDTDVLRILWYMYYLPMLFIPLISVFVSLGKSENYRIHKCFLLLYIPTVLLLLLVLTNDWHQWVFNFPGDIFSDREYGYSFGYWLVVVWEIICALTALIIMVLKCRIPRSRRILWLPFIPFAVSIVYAFFYLARSPLLELLAGDITAFQCLFYTAVFECCIRCGLIQSNTGYDAIFPVSSVCAQITDKDYNVRYISSSAAVLPKGLLRETEQRTVRLDRNTLLRGHCIRAGHVIWQEDITELADAMEQLYANKQALADANEVERENYRIQKKLARLREQNRLYDLIQSQTAGSYNKLKEILEQYDQCGREDERCRLLAEATVIGAYIKRRGNLILLGENEPILPSRELQLCLNESMQNLELLEINCEYTIKFDHPLPTGYIVKIYDLFEWVIESAINSITALWMYIAKREKEIIARIEVIADHDFVISAGEGTIFAPDGETAYHRGEDGSWIFTLHLPEGGEEA